MKVMKSYYTIGELARAADVPTSTIRYYERAGILAPAGRTNANYRRYDASSLERLQFIRAAQASGFSLDDISTLLELSDEPRGACQSVQKLIEHRLADVRKKLDDLQHVESVLASALRSCRKGDTPKACAVLNRLEAQTRKHPGGRSG